MKKPNNKEFLYLSKTRKEFKYIDNCAENTLPLGVRTIHNAAVGFWKPQIRFKKQPIKNIRIWKNSRANYIDKDVILLGFAEHHFGHFLADSLSRAWITLNHKYKNSEFIVVCDKELKPFAREFYKLLGIKNLTVIKNKTSFRSITIPDSSFNYPERFFDKKYADTLSAIASAVPVKKNAPKKIYYSRTKLAENPTIGEEIIQKIFADNGYTVIHIQNFSLVEQVAIARGATHIAGLSGTALHQSLFAADGIKLICMNRYNAAIPMQVLIGKLKKLDDTYIDASVDPYSEKKNESPITIVGINDNMKRFLDDNKFKYTIDAAADKKNMELFMRIWNAAHRRLPKWLTQIIVAIIPNRRARKNMRQKLGLSFAGITRDEINKRY